MKTCLGQARSHRFRIRRWCLGSLSMLISNIIRSWRRWEITGALLLHTRKLAKTKIQIWCKIRRRCSVACLKSHSSSTIWARAQQARSIWRMSWARASKTILTWPSRRSIHTKTHFVMTWKCLQMAKMATLAYILVWIQARHRVDQTNQTKIIKKCSSRSWDRKL